MIEQEQHETVGRIFRSWGGEYICTHYRPEAGFYMRCIKVPDPPFRREVGSVACVSERAIGRTYHLVRKGDDAPFQHHQECLCFICKRQKEAL